MLTKHIFKAKHLRKKWSLYGKKLRAITIYNAEEFLLYFLYATWNVAKLIRGLRRRETQSKVSIQW